MTEKKIKYIYKYKYIWNIFFYLFFYFIYLFIYLFIFIIIFRYAIAYLRTGSYAPVIANYLPPSNSGKNGVPIYIRDKWKNIQINFL